ncbi:MAG: ABC transporter ATP-binding protein [Simkaniaceae bacterium]|nr:ABC transporter ATP-binding protein [Simkaniaceae bacterium]
MKLLFKAALKTSKHILLLGYTLIALLALTLANQMEMFTLGVLTNQREKNPLGGLVNYIESLFNLSDQSVEAVIGLMVIVAIVKAFALFFSRYAAELFGIRVSRDLREDYFRHIQTLPMSFYQKYNIGSLSTRVSNDAYQIAYAVHACITNYFQAPFTLLINLSGCFYISWKLSLVIFFGVPMVILPIALVTRKVKKMTRALQKNQERFATVLIDFLAGIQTVKIFGMESFSLKKYQEQNNETGRLEAKTAKYDLLTRPILHTITTICLAVVVIFGLYILKLTLSELLVFCGLLYLVYEPVKKFAEENLYIQQGIVAAERMFEVLLQMPPPEDSSGKIEITSFNDSIEFDRVWFCYDEDRWVLRDVSFKVNKGETVAILGATGAGKSTIVNLIPRLFEAQKGVIKIDGLPIQAYTKESLRKVMAFVPQKPFLFLDTIASNISVGEPYKRDQVLRAAAKAHVSEFVEKLPKTYDTMLSEMGKNFSGGQQQRLAIARALIREAPILIFDEATSSLDPISEQRIKDAISELHGRVTQIIIAHRFSTIENADRIIFLDDGRVVGDGTLDELIVSCAPFRVMWESYKKHSHQPALS